MNKIEERAKIIAEMKEMNEKAKAESRSFTDEEAKALLKALGAPFAN